MKKRETHSLPLGICHKLFNFIMDSFIGRGLHRITMGHHPTSDQESTEVLIEFGGSSTEDEEKLKAKENPNSEIMIEFNHVNGLEKWSHNGYANQMMDQKKKKGMEIPNENSPAEISDLPKNASSPRMIFLNNINEESDAFIRRKKAALRKSSSLEQL